METPSVIDESSDEDDDVQTVQEPASIALTGFVEHTSLQATPFLENGIK